MHLCELFAVGHCQLLHANEFSQTSVGSMLVRNLSLVVVASLEPALPDVLGVRWERPG